MQNILVISTAKKKAKIFVVSADLPDFENYITIKKIEEVCSVYVCMYVCMYVCVWKYVYVYVWQQESNSYV
jgi:hypothetical protein